jgi:hypothetical protein
VIQWPLRFYAGLYIVMSLAMSRSQEREADRLMVQVAGRANSQAALREIHVIAAYWSAYDCDFLHRFVPFESIASAKVSGWFTIKATIKLRDGTTLRLKEPVLPTSEGGQQRSVQGPVGALRLAFRRAR